MYKTKKMREVLFYIGIFLMQFSIFAKNITIINKYYENLYEISIVILFICSIITLIFTKTSKKNWLIFILLIIISYFNYIITNDYILIILITSIISAYKIEFNKIIKNDLIFKTILFFIILSAYLTGNVEKIYFVRLGEIRYALGFNHPNSLGFYTLMYYFEYIYYYSMTNKTKGMKKYLVLIFINAIIFYLMNFAHSRTSEICIIIYNILLIKSFFTKKEKEDNKGHIIKYILLFFVLTALPFFLTKQYANGNEMAITINKMTSNRLYIQNQFLNLYKIKIFGNRVQYFVTLDNSYIRMALNYGIVAWILYGCIFTKILYTASKNKNKILEMTITIFMIYGIMEWYMVRPVINIFILFFPSTLLKENGENYEE